MTIWNASWWSVSAVVLACGLVGCPAINTPLDTGSDALDAFEPSDVHHERDAAVVDRDAPDAGSDSGATDAGADANTSDAAVCDCDDGIACTRDSCDAARSCVHWSTCRADEICNTDGTCSATPTCASALECPRDWFCEELLGCLGGRCAYRWNPDRDGDGVSDQSCGGNDCAPLDRTIPRVETCNSVDDDCNGRIDDIAGLDSDPNNCGACRHHCADARRDICVAGVCVCSADHTYCAEGDGCFDTQTDPLHCGSCSACPDGSTCEAGLCRYRATWMHGVDVATPEFLGGVLVAPNGDVLFAVYGRPTQLFHQGRATESIPPGPSPFTRHIVRLDRDGNLLGVTPIPEVWPDAIEASVLRRTFRIAVTDAGFYFAGTLFADTEVLGTTYLSGRSLVGYVPRTSSTIAWVRPLGARGVLSRAGTRDGSLVLLVYEATDARPFERRAIRRFDATGAELAHDDRFSTLLLEQAESVVASSAGGFIAVSRVGTGDLDSIPTYGDTRDCNSYALLFETSGLLGQAVCAGSLMSQHVFAERAGASAWLVHSTSLREFNRTPMSRYMGYPDYSPMFAAFDESGVVTSDQRPALVRFRDARAVETVVLPGVAALQEGSAWLLNTTASPALTRPFLLPGATTTIARIDLPPIP